MNIFSRAQHFLKAASDLRKVRKGNPTCLIQNCRLSEVSLGRYAAVLDGAILHCVTLGDISYVSTNAQLVHVSIGKFCSIGPDVKIGLFPHPTRSFVSTSPAFYSKGNIGCPLPLTEETVFDSSVPETVIGHDVWIGANVIIPGGVTIASGACIAAGAIVVKDVPPYAIVGGNPAALIRYRFSDAEIRMLLESKWWDWPLDELRKNAEMFSDINKFQGS
jgi:acetyltransferase-like isoleucine patch superfamily enzyme